MRGAHCKLVGEDETPSHHKPHDSQKGARQNQGLLSEERRVQTPHQAPQLLRPEPERGGPKTAGFETGRTGVQETHTRLWGTEDRLLKGQSRLPDPGPAGPFEKPPRPQVKAILLLIWKQGPAGRHHFTSSFCLAKAANRCHLCFFNLLK